MNLFHFVPLLALTSVTVAQNRALAPIDHVDPAATAYPFHVEGASYNTSYPFSLGVSRVQYVYEVWDSGSRLLDLPTNASIQAVSFPSDRMIQSFGHQLQLEVLIGHTQKTAADADRTFANNYTSPPQVVFARQIYQLPDLHNPLFAGGLVEEAAVNFDTPFVYNGTDNLLVEFRVTANSNGSRAFSYRLDVGSDVSPVRAHGLGCATSGGTTPTLTSTGTAIGDTWRIRLTGAPGSAATTLQIGFSQPAFPIDLGPAGAPGCTLDVISRAVVSGTTATNGTASWSFQVGNDISLWQLSVFSQALSADLFANSLGVVTSNADEMTLGVNPRITMIVSNGNATATTGSVNRNWGQLTYFHYN